MFLVLDLSLVLYLAFGIRHFIEKCTMKFKKSLSLIRISVLFIYLQILPRVKRHWIGSKRQ